MSRDIVFVSHANPEDNDFARWVTLQLASEGYPVWCDLTNLLGGETFWDDIQEAIKERTIKFLFVLSRSSNAKDGALQELDCAKGAAKKLKTTLRDFIVPLKIDDLAHDDVHITIRRLNNVSFNPHGQRDLPSLWQSSREMEFARIQTLIQRLCACGGGISSMPTRVSSTSLKNISQIGFRSAGFLKNYSVITSHAMTSER